MIDLGKVTKLKTDVADRKINPIVFRSLESGRCLAAYRMPVSGIYGGGNMDSARHFDLSDTDNVFTFANGTRIDFKQISHAEADPLNKAGSVIAVSDGTRKERIRVEVSLDEIYDKLEKADIFFNVDNGGQNGAKRIMALLPSDPTGAKIVPIGNAPNNG
jgi:hypothetical protein